MLKQLSDSFDELIRQLPFLECLVQQEVENFFLVRVTQQCPGRTSQQLLMFPIYLILLISLLLPFICLILFLITYIKSTAILLLLIAVKEFHGFNQPQHIISLGSVLSELVLSHQLFTI